MINYIVEVNSETFDKPKYLNIFSQIIDDIDKCNLFEDESDARCEAIRFNIINKGLNIRANVRSYNI